MCWGGVLSVAYVPQGIKGKEEEDGTKMG